MRGGTFLTAIWIAIVVVQLISGEYISAALVLLAYMVGIFRGLMDDVL